MLLHFGFIGDLVFMNKHAQAGHEGGRNAGGPATAKRRFSIAQQGATFRLAAAGALVIAIWAAIVPLLG